MKHSLLQRFRRVGLLLFLLAGTSIILDGCAPKPGCGSKRDHRKRKKRVKAFAPSMSFNYVKPVKGGHTRFV